MKILGIDFGERKIGLAIAYGPLASPFEEIKAVEWQRKIREICRAEEIEGLVVGVSEGEMAKKQKKFARQLRKVCGLPVFLVDETLTSKEAIAKMRQAGKKGNEDRFAATLLLQRFLERQKEDV